MGHASISVMARVKQEGPPMSLVNGQALFISQFKEQTTIPCGNPQEQIIGEPGNLRTVRFAAPHVEFQNHFYQTDDAEIAAGMVRNVANFHPSGKYGWVVDERCVPDAVRPYYNGLERDTKRKVMLALIAGEDPGDVLESVDPDELAGIRLKTQPTSLRMEMTCPIQGCGLVMAYEDDSKADLARQEIARHVRVSHPDAKVEKDDQRRTA